ncbi:hypothetical protein, partial [Pseudomonas mandelii]|uniref:hypothetical protein n=1 Tax=Pseudomonas mandelii TaxID=75612 RepID=UPI003D050CC4
MSIGNPVMAVKGTFNLMVFCLQLGRNAVVLSICPISTVSVVGSFNLRGIGTIFPFVDVSLLWRGGKGLNAGFIVGDWLGFCWCPHFNCGSEAARDGGLRADHVVVDRVHIRFCGNGGWRFRPYGESLLSNATKGTKKSRPKR